jgi:hypothetical protein
MSNKTALNKEVTSTAGANVIDISKKKDMASGKVLKKIKKPLKKSSVSQIDSIERSAFGAVKANSSRDVRGSSGLANTGTIISYD